MAFTRETARWEDYELLDTGGRMKLERFGAVTVERPEPQALWSPADPGIWKSASARYVQSGDDGSWQVDGDVSEDWTIRWEDLRFGLRMSGFKHTGVFPEQAINWDYLRGIAKPGESALNVFGYTGGATLALLSAGADVVHVDASRPAIAAAKRNAELSGLAGRPVRWIEDDAMKFVEREARRGRSYDIIVMDPPAFGRGPKKELWRFEHDLLPLLSACRAIARSGARLLVNAYSLGFPAISIEQTVRAAFPGARDITSVELLLRESTVRGFSLPAGVAVRARV